MTLATDNVNESTDCNAILLKGNAVAHTAIVQKHLKMLSFDLSLTSTFQQYSLYNLLYLLPPMKENDFFILPTKCTTNLWDKIEGL